jgi:carbamoyl-phosphate synthase small subunit
VRFSSAPLPSGLVCKNFSFNYSRPDASGSLESYFVKQNLICISDVDTRALVSYIRDNGAMNAVICTDDTSVEELKVALANVPDMKGLELASKVSTLFFMVTKCFLQDFCFRFRN